VDRAAAEANVTGLAGGPPHLDPDDMSKLTAKIREEIKKLLPPTIFFFIALHLVAIFRVLMLKGTRITLSSSASNSLGALILGKAVLIADLFPFINRYPDKPLAYSIAWKTAIYMLIAMLIHYLERLVDFWRETGGFVSGNQKLLAEIVWPHFWAIQILLVLLILMYCTIREVVRAIGVDNVRTMFFGPPPKSLGSQQCPRIMGCPLAKMGGARSFAYLALTRCFELQTVAHARAATPCFSGGQGRNRTTDTRIFSPLPCELRCRITLEARFRAVSLVSRHARAILLLRRASTGR
jgi:hypothetical protein